MRKPFKSFVALAGLPRTGSTLLSALLDQNPKIHVEGNSGLCQIMWDTYNSCRKNCAEQLKLAGREHTTFDLVSEIPSIYYKNNTPEESIVVDKCRSWTAQPNIEMINKFIGKETKVVVLVRPLTEIVSSFVKAMHRNNMYTEEKERLLLFPNSNPIMNALEGEVWARNNNKDNKFLFVEYKNLVKNPTATLKAVYKFCGWEAFIHNVNNVEAKFFITEETSDTSSVSYGLEDLHKVRRKIKLRKYNVTLLPETVRNIDYIEGRAYANSR